MLVSTHDKKIRIELGSGYQDHYDNMMKKIIDNEINPFMSSSLYSAGILNGVEKIINEITNPVTYYEYFKVQIYVVIFSLFSVLFAFYTNNQGKTGVFLFLISFVGFVIIWFIDFIILGNRTNGHGGGNSDGDGASGFWGDGDGGDGGD